jgi:hypothetical protein
MWIDFRGGADFGPFSSQSFPIKYQRWHNNLCILHIYKVDAGIIHNLNKYIGSTSVTLCISNRNQRNRNCKSIVVIMGTEFDAVCRYFSSEYPETYWHLLCQISSSYVIFFSVKFYFEVNEINVKFYHVAFLFSEKHILRIHFGENFIDIWGGADFGPFSSQSLPIKYQRWNNNLCILHI